MTRQGPNPIAWTPEAQRALARWKPVSSLKNRVAAHAVTGMSRFIMRRLNTLKIEGYQSFLATQGQTRGLLTFSNHVSLFDDPLLTSCMSGSEWSGIRWIAADALNFFGTPLLATVFNAGKCVPVVRGAGLVQPGMHFLAERLRDGEWVHIFPEGGRTRAVDGLLQTPLKTGLGELVRASKPVVLPFHHNGMREILPIGSRFPRFGKTVMLRFGEPLDTRAGLAELSTEEITDWATRQLLALQEESP